MKTLILFLLFTSLSFAQTAKEVIIDKLTKSSDTTSIYGVKRDLNNQYTKYAAYFNFLPSINPLNPKKQKRFSSKFGKRFHPIDKVNKAHHGLDISAPLATPIHAAASGVVLNTIKSNTGYGNKVTLKHLYGFTTVYAHMAVFIVKKGERVKKGQIIGYVGNTGKSTAPHLHYEIRKYNKPIDPFPFCFLKL